MPLSKRRNRDRMRILRATYVQPKAVQPVKPDSVYTMDDGFIPFDADGKQFRPNRYQDRWKVKT